MLEMSEQGARYCGELTCLRCWELAIIIERPVQTCGMRRDVGENAVVRLLWEAEMLLCLFGGWEGEPQELICGCNHRVLRRLTREYRDLLAAKLLSLDLLGEETICRASGNLFERVVGDYVVEKERNSVDEESYLLPGVQREGRGGAGTFAL